MASANLTSMDAVVRELWPQQRVNNLTYQASAFWGMVGKDPKFTEKKRHIALRYGNPQGRSATFSTAQTNATASKFDDFEITRISDYAVGTIDGETLEATEDNKAALVDALETETEGALDELANTLSFDLWKAGSGSRGRVATSGITTTSLTLATRDDVVNFEVNMEVVVGSSETAAVRSGSATITGIDYDNGKLTTDSNWTSQISGATDADYIFVQGDAQNGGSAVKKVSGVSAWIPTSAPSATTFFGIDRTAHNIRLGGVRHDGSGDGTIKEALKNLAAKIRFYGGRRAKPDVVFLNTMDLNKLDLELGNERRYERIDVKDADVGYDAITFHTPAGVVRAVEDRYVPQGYAWMLMMSTWEFASLKAAPRMIRHDGLNVARQSSADGVEYRAVYRGQLSCDAPGWNGVATLPS